MRIPAIAEADEIHEIETIWGPRCFARRQGEALHPEREPLETLEREKAGRSHRLQAASTSSTSIDSPEHGVPGAVFGRDADLDSHPPLRAQSCDPAMVHQHLEPNFILVESASPR